MALTKYEEEWYIHQIQNLDPKEKLIQIDKENEIISYSSSLKSDETSQKDFNPEEFVHALIFIILCSKEYKYPTDSLYHEQYFKHGSTGSLSDEVDYMIYDEDKLPFALWEIKSAEEFERKQEETIQYQLFGTAPLTGAPKFLVFATIFPKGETPKIELKCIDYLEFQSYSSWLEADKPFYSNFPPNFEEIDYKPLINGSKHDLRLDCTQADFRSVATVFHNEFFGEHPDNVLFVSLVKCILAKIYDERITKKNSKYSFQIFLKNGKPEKAKELFDRVNNLYSTAYKKFIDPTAKEVDEINPREFSPEKVKTIVKVLQTMSITKGASIHGDVIGAFFEEILRFGFKQDKGMYFTHANIVKFMLNALDIDGLTKKTWENATHPENRLPYIIDPACGSGTFLLNAMNHVTSYVKSNEEELITDLEAEEFYNARMSGTKPNYWAENFIYGMDPKFIMAITAKVNMVLHGDGSAHIYKYDAYKGFSEYDATKLQIANEKNRTIPRASYDYDTSETFDLVISNPPFGVTLTQDTKSKLQKNFKLKETLSSEALFLERCFQLLKPGGRLGLVIPESLINTAENIDVRLFLYKHFKVRSIVGLPRNIFKDTPTLCSLLFAQKKTKKEIENWDTIWTKEENLLRQKIKKVKSYLAKESKKEKTDNTNIKANFIKELSPLINEKSWFLKRGKNSQVLSLNFDERKMNKTEMIYYFKKILSVSGFENNIVIETFKRTSFKENYSFPVYMVDEVGYKLSNRKEKNRPNQLMKIIGNESEIEKPNFHLIDEDFDIVIDTKNPITVLDHIKKTVVWE